MRVLLLSILLSVFTLLIIDLIPEIVTAGTWTLSVEGGGGVWSCSGHLSCPLTDGFCPTIGATKFVPKCGCDGIGPFSPAGGDEWMTGYYDCTY